MFAIRLNGETGLNRRDHIVQQVPLENGKCRGRFKGIPSRPIVLLGATIRHDDNHRHGFVVRDQIVEQPVGCGETLPFGLITADSVQQIEHRILLILRVPRWRIDIHLARGADRLGVVLDHLQLAMPDFFASGNDALRRVGIDLFVVRTKLNGTAEAARTTTALRPVGL